MNYDDYEIIEDECIDDRHHRDNEYTQLAALHWPK